MQVFGNVFGGLFLGLLTGLLVGLSVSPVVGTIVGALTAGLSLFLGFKGTSRNTDPSSDIKLGFFAAACIFGVFAGLYIRTHDLAAPAFLEEKPSLKDEFSFWKSLPNITDNEARSLVIYRRLNLVPTGYVVGKTQPDSRKSYLFSADKDEDEGCEVLDEGRYLSNAARVEAIKVFFNATHDAKFGKLLTSLEKQKSPEYQSALISGTRIGSGC